MHMIVDCEYTMESLYFCYNKILMLIHEPGYLNVNQRLKYGVCIRVLVEIIKQALMCWHDCWV